MYDDTVAQLQTKKIIFYSFSPFVFSHSQFSLSLSHRAPTSSLFLSSHITFSRSKLAPKLGWIRGHNMEIGVDFGWFGGWCWDKWGWQCVVGWHVGSVVAMLWLVLEAEGEREEKEEKVKQ